MAGPAAKLKTRSVADAADAGVCRVVEDEQVMERDLVGVADGRERVVGKAATWVAEVVGLR